VTTTAATADANTQRAPPTPVLSDGGEIWYVFFFNVYILN